MHPENNRYAYKLDNFDRDWIYTNASKRSANYTNLDPGDYTFEVKQVTMMEPGMKHQLYCISLLPLLSGKPGGSALQ